MTQPPPNAGPVDLLRPGVLLREWRIGRRSTATPGYRKSVYREGGYRPCAYTKDGEVASVSVPGLSVPGVSVAPVRVESASIDSVTLPDAEGTEVFSGEGRTVYSTQADALFDFGRRR